MQHTAVLHQILPQLEFGAQRFADKGQSHKGEHGGSLKYFSYIAHGLPYLFRYVLLYDVARPPRELSQRRLFRLPGSSVRDSSRYKMDDPDLAKSYADFVQDIDCGAKAVT